MNDSRPRRVPRPQPESNLERRVVAAAEQALAHGGVSPLNVFSLIGWLPWNLVDQWRQGRFEYLMDRVQASPDKKAKALEHFHRWAEAKGLEPNEVAYVSATRDRRTLQVTREGDPDLERAYRTHWTAPGTSRAKRERLTERESRPPDLIVVDPRGRWKCTSCAETWEKGTLLIMEGPGPLCLECADMDHLVFLPAGDATLTRRAKKASGLSAVVVRRSRTRHRYERQGILVEEAALELAEEQCLADEEVRARRRDRDRDRRAVQDLELQARMAKEIARMFPGCPTERAESIARHAATRGSGRVGRSAAGRALEEHAVRSAVVASVRHEDTKYDELLMTGVPRKTAREKVRSAIDGVLDGWRSLPPTG